MSTATAPAKTGARVCSILGIVFGVVAVLFMPIIFGLAGIVLSIVGYSMGDKQLGKWAIVISVLGTVLGFVLGYLVVTS
jgi:4-hydroxybenzoate polyprenyltransferase